MAATPTPTPTHPPDASPARRRGRRFRYEEYSLQVDRATGGAVLECHYSLDDLRFTERFAIRLPTGGAPGGAAGPAASPRRRLVMGADISQGEDLAPATPREGAVPSKGSSPRERPAPAAGPSPGDRASRARARAREAARLVHLLAGVSYYKTLVPPVVDLGAVPTTPAERAFLRTFLLDGLAEMAYRNGLDLSDLQIVGPDAPGADGPERPIGRDGLRGRAGREAVARATRRRRRHERRDPDVAQHRSAEPLGRSGPGRSSAALRPLVPFGGGIDSIVTVEDIRRRAPDTTLFVVAPAGSPFAAADAAIAVSGLPVVRVERTLDPQVLRSTEHGFWNGHVPVTGILSALAVLAAVLGDHDAVVMSNEHSASAATLVDAGRPVNHQWSKGAQFEDTFRTLLAARLGPAPEYFSSLRGRSELWVAQRFAGLSTYHPVFRSCNRAFHVDPDARATAWCGRCDKCCFIDLVLAPFMDRVALERVFGGREPLTDPALAEQFRVLLGTSDAPRPFECVGDVTECRVAARQAAARPDRAGTPLLQTLAAELGAAPTARAERAPRTGDAPGASRAPGGSRAPGAGDAPGASGAPRGGDVPGAPRGGDASTADLEPGPDLAALLRPQGPDHVPDAYAAPDVQG